VNVGGREFRVGEGEGERGTHNENNKRPRSPAHNLLIPLAFHACSAVPLQPISPLLPLLLSFASVLSAPRRLAICNGEEEEERGYAAPLTCFPQGS
jgi:hypothetical protein